MHATKVESNVKRGVNAALSPVTLVVGPNGSGKSSLVQSLRLGLTGKLEGEVSSAADLFLLHPAGEGALTVEVALSDGENVASNKWTVTGSTAKASKPQWVTGLPRAAIVSDLVRALLAKSGRALREALLAACAPKDAIKKTQATVPGAFLPLFDRAVAQAKTDEGDAALDSDVLVAALAILRKQLRDGRKIVKAAQAGEALPAKPSDEEVARLRAEVTKWETVARVLARLDAGAAKGAALREQIATMPPAEVAPASKAELEATAARLKMAKALRERIIEKSVPQCFVCGQDVGPAGLLAAGERQALVAEHLRTLIPAAIAGRSRAELVAELEALTVQHEQDALWLKDNVGFDAPVDPILAGTQLNEARLKLGEVEQRLRAYDAAVAARSAAHATAAQIDGLAALVKSVERSVKELLFDSLASFEERAALALPAGYRIKIALYDGERQIAPRVLLGWTEGGTEVWRALSAISGSQRALLLTAVAQAWASECSEPMKLLVVDEVWMGDSMIEALLTALASAVTKHGGLTQAVVCVCSYNGPPVPGVTRVVL